MAIPAELKQHRKHSWTGLGEWDSQGSDSRQPGILWYPPKIRGRGTSIRDRNTGICILILSLSSCLIWDPIRVPVFFFFFVMGMSWHIIARIIRSEWATFYKTLSIMLGTLFWKHEKNCIKGSSDWPLSSNESYRERFNPPGGTCPQLVAQ